MEESWSQTTVNSTQRAADPVEQHCNDQPANGMPIDRALATLEQFAGTQFDPQIVVVFTEFLRAEERQAKA
jgi:hypothetical protein